MESTNRCAGCPNQKLLGHPSLQDFMILFVDLAAFVLKVFSRTVIRDFRHIQLHLGHA